MTTLLKAAQQALEALESTQLYSAHEHYPRRRVADAITALRAALEQPEQEPVAWQYKKEGGGIFVSDQCPADVEVWNDIEWSKPLFTHPPRREWRGLSKDESLKLWGMRSDGPSNTEITSFARAIEAALKEKNT